MRVLSFLESHGRKAKKAGDLSIYELTAKLEEILGVSPDETTNEELAATVIALERMGKAYRIRDGHLLNIFLYKHKDVPRFFLLRGRGCLLRGKEAYLYFRLLCSIYYHREVHSLYKEG